MKKLLLFSLFLVFGISSASAETCTDIQYGEWGECLADVQSRDFIDFLPSGCEVVEGITPSPEVQQSCVSVTPCESVTYSAWSICDENNTQTRNVATSTPSGCDWSTISGPSDLIQPCEFSGAILSQVAVNLQNSAGHTTNGVLYSMESLIGAYVPTIVGLFIIGLALTLLFRLLTRSKNLVLDPYRLDSSGAYVEDINDIEDWEEYVDFTGDNVSFYEFMSLPDWKRAGYNSDPGYDKEKFPMLSKSEYEEALRKGYNPHDVQMCGSIKAYETDFVKN